jgi:hypothetical protein
VSVWKYAFINIFSKLKKMTRDDLGPSALKVVSLPSADERRESLLRQSFFLARCVEVIEAVNGKQIEWERYSDSSRSIKFLGGRKLSAGEVGCALSHLTIYKTLDKEQGSALIFEDDVIESEVTESLFFLDSQSSNTKSFMCFYGCQQGLKLHKVWRLAWVSWYVLLGRVRMTVPSCLARRLYRTAAYRISGAAAQSIIRSSSSGLRCADDFAGHANDTGARLYFVPIFQHPADLASSGIEHERR